MIMSMTRAKLSNSIQRCIKNEIKNVYKTFSLGDGKSGIKFKSNSGVKLN